MTILLIIVIPTILIIGLFKSYREQSEYTLNGCFFVKLALISFIIGGYDGFFGPGTGTFLFLAFMYLLSMSAKESVTNAKIINFVANFSALLYFLFAGRIDWNIVLIALPASILGYQLGAHFVLKADLRWVKKVVTVVLIGLMVKLVFLS